MAGTSAAKFDRTTFRTSRLLDRQHEGAYGADPLPAGRLAADEWPARGGTRVPVDPNDAVPRAHMLRRPPAVVANDNNGFVSAIPVWN